MRSQGHKMDRNRHGGSRATALGLLVLMTAVFCSGFLSPRETFAEEGDGADEGTGTGQNTLPPMVTPQTEAAIQRGVKYLVASQGRDGSWRSNQNRGSYPCAMTSLAGLALMSAGHTPTEGEYSENVRRAVNYVLGCADRSTGLIASLNESSRPMYGHGFAMLFLSQAYGMERDPVVQDQIRKVLTRAVALTGRAQSKYGGWWYTPDSANDEGSVTITQVQGLRACRDAGIQVPKEIIDRSVNYIVKSANPDGGIRYRVTQKGNSLPAITSQAVVVLMSAGGEYETPVGEKAMDYIRKLMRGGKTTSVFRGHNTYATFYCSQAMYRSGEKDWNWYFPSVRDEIVKSQQRSGDGSGFWRGDYVGETYGTAVRVMCLSLPYGYLPAFQR